MALTMFVFTACKVPEQERPAPESPALPHTKTMTPLEREIKGVGLPETPQVKFDIIAEKDYDQPWLIHFIVYPLVDPVLIAENPGGRLFVEIHPPRGTTLVDGMHRKRFSLAGINEQMMESDIRVDVFGELEVRVTGFLADRSGNRLMRSDAYFIINSKQGGEIELKGQRDKKTAGKAP